MSVSACAWIKAQKLQTVGQFLLSCPTAFSFDLDGVLKNAESASFTSPSAIYSKVPVELQEREAGKQNTYFKRFTESNEPTKRQVLLIIGIYSRFTFSVRDSVDTFQRHACRRGRFEHAIKRFLTIACHNGVDTLPHSAFRIWVN